MVKNSKAIVATAAIALVSLIAGIFIGVAVSLPFGRGDSGTVNPDSTVLTPTFKVDGENSYEDCEVFDFPSEMMFYQMSSTSTESGRAILVATVEPAGIDEEDADVTWSVAWADSANTADINEYIQMSDVTVSDNVSLVQNQRAKAFVALKPWVGEIRITVTTVIGGFTAQCSAIHGAMPTSVKLFKSLSDSVEQGQEYSKVEDLYYAMFSNAYSEQQKDKYGYLKFYNAKGEYIDADVLDVVISSVNYSLSAGLRNTRADLVLDSTTGTKYFDDSTVVTDYANPYFGLTEGGLGSAIVLEKITYFGVHYWALFATNYCYSSVSTNGSVTILENYLMSGTPHIRLTLGGFGGQISMGLGYECVEVTGVNLDYSELDFTS